MLLGQFTSKLTDKDRISIPKKIREELGEEVILARWYESSLVLVSKAQWEMLIQRLIGDKDLIISPVRDIDRFVLGSAFEIKLDAQGRFILPEQLKHFAEITDEVVFVGLGDRIEIWSSQKWRELEQRAQTAATAAIEKIAADKR